MDDQRGHEDGIGLKETNRLHFIARYIYFESLYQYIPEQVGFQPSLMQHYCPPLIHCLVGIHSSYMAPDMDGMPK
jgi:hypothetical protein